MPYHYLQLYLLLIYDKEVCSFCCGCISPLDICSMLSCFFAFCLVKQWCPYLAFNLIQKIRLFNSLRIFDVLIRTAPDFPNLLQCVYGSEWNWVWWFRHHQGCVMGGGVVKNHFGISVTCQVTLFRQVCMKGASLSTLTLGMCPLMGFILSSQSIFGLPGFLDTSFHSAHNLETHSVASVHSKLSLCWIMISMQWFLHVFSGSGCTFSCISMGLDVASWPQGGCSLPGQAPPLP